MKLFSNFLRDLALDRENLAKSVVILLRPDMRVGARVDQLRVQVNLVSVPAHATFQQMGDPKDATNLPRVSHAAVLHDARSADHLEVGDLRQLG